MSEQNVYCTNSIHVSVQFSFREKCESHKDVQGHGP